MRKILLYIVYGDRQVYYDGAKFSFLTFMKWISITNKVEIVILTEKPDEFINYPVNILPINKEQKNSWSLNNSYHFRIKNRGLCYVIDKLALRKEDKILFVDTDTYFNKSPIPLFELIQPSQALLYLNEGLIYKRKRFNIFIESLEGHIIDLGDFSYQLTKRSAMWGALMIGVMPNMLKSLELADKLMLKFIDMVPVHTIEQFSLSEILAEDYKIVEGKKYISLYSTSGKTEYAKVILTKFFKQNTGLSNNEKIINAQRVKIKRPISVIMKQRLLKLAKNNAK